MREQLSIRPLTSLHFMITFFLTMSIDSHLFDLVFELLLPTYSVYQLVHGKSHFHAFVILKYVVRLFELS